MHPPMAIAVRCRRRKSLMQSKRLRGISRGKVFRWMRRRLFEQSRMISQRSFRVLVARSMGKRRMDGSDR
jgi:hypothetical protein